MQKLIFTRGLNEEKIEALDSKYGTDFFSRYSSTYPGAVIFVDPKNNLTWSEENYAEDKIIDSPKKYRKYIPVFEEEVVTTTKITGVTLKVDAPEFIEHNGLKYKLVEE